MRCTVSICLHSYYATQPSIPLGSVNEYQLQLGRQRQVWLISIADEHVGVQVKQKSLENMCHTCASAVVIHHEEALYQVYASLPFTC